MMDHVDRVLVEELLADGCLSYREIGRRAQCSDFAVRAIARQLSGDLRPMKSARRSHDNEEPLSASGWATIAGMAVVLLGLLWWVARRPPEGGAMP